MADVNRSEARSDFCPSSSLNKPDTLRTGSNRASIHRGRLASQLCVISSEGPAVDRRLRRIPAEQINRSMLHLLIVCLSLLGALFAAVEWFSAR
jgi:hypothetical protein